MYPSPEEIAQAEETSAISQRKMKEFFDLAKSGPTRAETDAKDAERKRIKNMIHHFRVLEDSSKYDGISTETLRYRKTRIKYELDMAILRDDENDIEKFKSQISELIDVEEIPEGQFLA